MISRRFNVLAAVALGVVAGCSGHDEHWSYSGEDGPSHWGETWTLAVSGHEQSPIDIRDTRPASLQEIEFHFEPGPGSMVNNGHTIMIEYEGERSWIRVDGIRYHFRQMHFHSPSEHTIDGEFFDMEFHLVFEDEVGHFAVVGVLAKEGAGDPVFDLVWTRVPKTPGETVHLDDLGAPVGDFLPRDRRYYRYRGSLTTPPCTEGVIWLVLKTPVSMSAEQIDRFHTWYDHTNRPVQPLYDRVVLDGQ